MVDALGLIVASHWLILPDYLERMLAIAARDYAHQALATRAGTPLDNTMRTIIRPNGTAVVPIVGPIFKRANLFTAISGGTSTELLARDMQAALDDPAVKSIVLDIDSPGGDAVGINELADMIYRARGSKPITAYAGGTMASAAYWIGSAANSIVADPTAIVGSIGVVSEVVDTTARDAKNGVRTYQIVSSNAPNKRPDPSTEAGRAQFQQVLDDIEHQFVASVARNRGVTAGKVIADYGRGGVLAGSAAVKVGMVDRLGNLENTIATSRQSQSTRTITMSDNTTTTTDDPRFARYQALLAERRAVETAVRAAEVAAAEVKAKQQQEARDGLTIVVSRMRERHFEAESKRNAVFGRAAKGEPAAQPIEPATTSSGLWDHAIAKVTHEQLRRAGTGDAKAAIRRMAGH